KITVNYTIKGKRQNVVSLNPASIEFYYLHKKTVFSNIVIIKIITPKSRQFLYISLPILIGLASLSIYFWQIKKYKKKKIAYERSEKSIFELSSRESILKINQTLRERLNIILKASREQSPDVEKNEELKRLTNDNKKREI
ncbi:MAG: hypothetical protein ACFFAV_04880, partial [Candidatus Hermodarchaeota archaeon]